MDNTHPLATLACKLHATPARIAHVLSSLSLRDDTAIAVRMVVVGGSASYTWHALKTVLLRLFLRLGHE